MIKRFLLVLASILLFSTALTGCGAKEKVDQAINPPMVTIEHEEADEQAQAETIVISEAVSKDMKEQAKIEGVSVDELQNILDGLAELGAEKYGITVDEYISQIESNGDTVLSEWQVASATMGISITELYEYEKNSAANMTDEQKAMMQGMGDALKIAESEMADAPAIGTTDVGNLLGIEENATGETRVVSMTEEDLRAALTVDSYKVLQDYTDEYSIVYEYITDAAYEDITTHYIDLVVNTEEYLKIEPAGDLGVMLQGTLNETTVYIEVDNSDPGKIRVNTYLDLTTTK
ncbi:hypothetical protein SANA_14010 [Gottschalkiaceae bacterium SANA]|nr:hypothetical protein SANA_14010 [Gottschalkiaceae bacterium SANA]